MVLKPQRGFWHLSADKQNEEIMKKNRVSIVFLLLFCTLILGGCASQEKSEKKVEFKCTRKVELKYATQFSIEEYGKYDMITIKDSGRFLIVPKGEKVPGNLPKDVTVLKRPLNNTYLVATSAMDLIQSSGAMDNIRLSGTKADGWYIKEAAKAMNDGKIKYAGKYSAPDYELILNEGCNLAIESTMIYHNPEVKEKLESLGIPVLVERSSYEKHPLGRLEWIKLYGVLFDRKKEANDFYEKEMKKIEPVMKQEDNSDAKTVAFFYVMTNGAVSVRKPNDYIAKSISLAGGKYVPSNIDDEEKNALSTLNMQMEDFYAATRDADILIYNSTIDGQINSIDDLIRKNKLFSDFKAVKNKNVYCTSGDFFQKTTGVGDFIVDMGNVLKSENEEENTYIKKLR